MPYKGGERITFLKGKTRSAVPTEVLQAFVQSWEMHGSDEMSICSGTLDVLRAYLGERPCCLWKRTGSSLEKLCERGMVDVAYSPHSQEHQAALTRALVSGQAEFDPCEFEPAPLPLPSAVHGFLHVPLKTKTGIMGILSVGVSKKESRDRDFVDPLESLGHLVAIAVQMSREQIQSDHRTSELKAVVGATSRELQQTNKTLIERVKELKTLYKELQKRVQELTNANKAKDEFLSIVSHELRTPLTSLTGFLAVVLDEETGPLNEQQRKFLGIAKQSANRLNLIISDLLDISRIESGRLNLEMQDCSMVDILHASIEGFRKTSAAKSLNLTLNASAQLTHVWGDASRLQQVVDNLIANAIKFTDTGGQIAVSAEEKGDFVQVSVKDSGIGMDPDQQEKVFDMFYQVDATMRRSAGGVGLGLAIARGIIMRHGGQILIESEKSKGSTFTIMIPRSRAHLKAA